VCNLYSVTTNQETIRALVRVINRCIGNLPPMPGVLPGLSCARRADRWPACPTPRLRVPVDRTGPQPQANPNTHGPQFY
jgi:hypothetical protein